MDPPLDPEEATAAGAPVSTEVPPATRMGSVGLSVADLSRSVDYYQNAVGLALISRDGPRALLGVEGTVLLELYEEPGVRPSTGYCGLYHFALLVPRRSDLARWLAHAARERVALTGMADHFVSEALYLSDPDEHGIEIYWDRPRELWEGKVAEQMTTARLDVDDLMSVLDREVAPRSFDGLAPGTTMGHVHLKVSSIGDTVEFYRDRLGFGLMATFGRQAAFLSAGGYHHHLGANTWESAGRPPAPAGTARLLKFNIVVPTAGDRGRMAARFAGSGRPPAPVDGAVTATDPSGNPVALVAAM